ncbi:MAG: hypothetical protein ACOZAO_02555 [Patescibacteria group bacterium]
MKSKLSKKYQTHLEKTKSTNFNEKWLELHTDLINTTESTWDYNSIRYDTVMNLKEWKEFSEHPERKPYKSKLGFNSDINKSFETIIELLKDSYAYYKTLEDSEYKNKLKVGISTLLKCALNAKYDLDDLRRGDEYYGRTAQQRDNGEIEPTIINLTRLEFAIKEYANFANKDYKKLRNKIFEISEGRVSVLSNYYSNCDVPVELRKDIQGIFDVLRRDLTLLISDVQLAWEVWKKIHYIGLNVDEFLQINDLPKYEVVKRNLLAFQNDKNHVSELEKHMKDDLPESFKKYKEQGYILFDDLFAEEATRKKYPKKLRNLAEIEKMIDACKKEVYKLFPLAKVDSPRSVLFNPTHPSATTRAFQSATKNTKGLQVNAIVMTPRVLMKDEYLPVFAHETAHALHRIILSLGEEHNILEKGAQDRVPSSVMEDFSQLLEHQFYKDKHLPYKKQFKGEEFPNFMTGITIRAQVPFALVQLGVRKIFDNWLKEGHQYLTERMLWELKQKFEDKTDEIETLGLKTTRRVPSGLRYLHPYNPDDGLVYMKRYIVKEVESEAERNHSEKKQKNSQIDMPSAFKQRFGETWEQTKDARAMFLWLLLESGRNYNTQTFHEFILNKDISECYSELTKLGVNKSKI